MLALQRYRQNPDDLAALATVREHEDDLGYAMLLMRYAPDLTQATPVQIAQAARDAIPPVWLTFWSFRLMIGMAFLMLIYLIAMTTYSLSKQCVLHHFLLKISIWMLPVPFLACELGWLTAELGRQPWTVYEKLPTWISASTHSAGYLYFSLIGFTLIYLVFITIEMFLMVKFVRQGPGEHSHRPITGGGGGIQPVLSRPVMQPEE
jgi:cytochrome d ubiquinol oxidase subunit I